MFKTLLTTKTLPSPSSSSSTTNYVHTGRKTALYVFLINTITLAQPVFNRCGNTGNYTVNSTYQTNLGATLSALPTTNSGLGFFNFSLGEGNSTVNSIALCRGDVNPDFNPEITTDINGFNRALRPLMDELRGTAAAGGPLLKFATGNRTGPGFTRIYGLVQCSPYLTEQQCSDCLEEEVSLIGRNDNGKVGGKIVLPTCNFRFETYSFFNQSNLATFPLTPPPSPQPTVCGLAVLRFGVPLEGKKKNTTRTVTIVIVIVTMILVIIVASLCVFLRMKKKNKPTPPLIIERIQTETIDIGTSESLQYDFSTMKAATNDFSQENKLGVGGFGAVYRGKLEDGREVAVKRLSKDSGQGDLEFKNEAWESWNNGTGSDMIDPTLKTAPGSLRNIIRSIHIGLLCVQENLNHRPTMATVVLMLNSLSISLPVPSEPAFFMKSNINPERPLLQEYSSSTGSGGFGKPNVLKAKPRSREHI
ncbi:hypothetical protein M8C21_024019, partial [Ambrosia artemisiifolia]